MRALLESSDPSVEVTTYQDKPVWKLATPVQPNMLSDVSADHIEVTVNQDTGFPVRVLETRAGRFVQETRLEDVRLDEAIPPGTFSLTIPDDAEKGGHDAGFRRVSVGSTTEGGLDSASLEQIESYLGYEPPVPAWVPEGYTLTEAAMARIGQPTGKEGMNPESEGVLALAYRRGFDRVIVTVRLTGEDPKAWSDPLSGGEGFKESPEKVRLNGGSFDECVAEILIDAHTEPHLWTLNDKHVITVAGDVDREELLRVAQSMSEMPTGG